MNNKNIGILEYYFTQAGERSSDKVQEVLKKAEEYLYREGIREIASDEENNVLKFKVSAEKYENLPAEYELDVSLGERKIYLKQKLFQENKKSAIHSMRWYINRRNRNMPKGMKYYLSPVRLECSISMNGDWENELLRHILDMMCITGDDYKSLEYLKEGIVPDKIQCMIRQEYERYEGEIANGISIRENDSGFE